VTTVFITNIPAPYRERLHELVGLSVDNYRVIYCASIEQNRDWEFTLGDYQHQFLRSRTLVWKGRTIYLDSNVIAVLNDLKPSVVINGGFSLPGIQSFFWAKWHGKKFVSLNRI